GECNCRPSDECRNAARRLPPPEAVEATGRNRPAPASPASATGGATGPPTPDEFDQSRTSPESSSLIRAPRNHRRLDYKYSTSLRHRHKRKSMPVFNLRESE